MAKAKEKKQAPEWLLKRGGITQRQWKARKRQELKAVIKAFDTYHCGCAFTPGTSGEVGIIDEQLEKLRALHSVKQWGR